MIRRNSKHGLPALLPALRRTWQRLCAWERRQAGLDQSLFAEEQPQGEATFGMIEIARKDGVEFRSVRLRLEDDGGIKMDAQDIGPTVTQFWDHDDYEFWVRVPPVAHERPRCALCSGSKINRRFSCTKPRHCGKNKLMKHKDDAWCCPQ